VGGCQASLPSGGEVDVVGAVQSCGEGDEDSARS
jgi:hypothetical protein